MIVTYIPMQIATAEKMKNAAVTVRLSARPGGGRASLGCARSCAWMYPVTKSLRCNAINVATPTVNADCNAYQPAIADCKGFVHEVGLRTIRGGMALA